MRTRIEVLAGIPAVALLLGCGTMINGTSRNVGFASLPRGATVTVDGVYVGNTPVVVPLSTARSHEFHMDLDGYEPFDGKLDRSFSAWSLIGAWYIVPTVVDLVNGGAYTFKTEQVGARLVKAERRTSTPGHRPAPGGSREVHDVSTRTSFNGRDTTGCLNTNRLPFMPTA